MYKRQYLYNGQLDSCEKAISKAAQFKELHLGTTLGQVQYDFTVNVVKSLLVNQKIERLKFFNSGWWYSIPDLLTMSALIGERFLLQFAIVNEFANNPERQNVIYSLFSSENVIGFDEVWNVIKDISPEYFTGFFKQQMELEKRKNIQRYMQFFYGNFLVKTGEKEEGKKVLENILRNIPLDTAHEKLFQARVTETLAKQYEDDKDKSMYNTLIAFYLKKYPQLLPFSGLKIKMSFNIQGINDYITKSVVNELKDCNISRAKSIEASHAVANINFEKKKNKYELTYSVKTRNGNPIVAQNRVIFKDPSGMGKELALRLFGVSGPLEYEVINN